MTLLISDTDLVPVKQVDFPILFCHLLLGGFRLELRGGLAAAGFCGLLLKKLFVYSAPNTIGW